MIEVSHTVQTQIKLFPLWREVPHQCDPDCPGEQNRRKLAAAEELLVAAKEVWAFAVGHDGSVLDNGLPKAIANYEGANHVPKG